MPAKSVFSDLMQDLLRQMGIVAPTDATHEIYTVHFEDEPDIHFICRDAKSLEVICEAGRMNNPDAPGKLLDLLELNGMDRARFAVHVTIRRESGTVIVWFRQALAELEACALMELLQCFRAKVHAVMRLPDWPPDTALRQAGSTLSRVLRPIDSARHASVGIPAVKPPSILS